MNEGRSAGPMTIPVNSLSNRVPLVMEDNGLPVGVLPTNERLVPEGSVNVGPAKLNVVPTTGA